MFAYFERQMVKAKMLTVKSIIIKQFIALNQGSPLNAKQLFLAISSGFSLFYLLILASKHFEQEYDIHKDFCKKISSINWSLLKMDDFSAKQNVGPIFVKFTVYDAFIQYYHETQTIGIYVIVKALVIKACLKLRIKALHSVCQSQNISILIRLTKVTEDSSNLKFQNIRLYSRY